MQWVDRAPGLDGLDAETRRDLEAIRPITISKGHVLFRPGDEVTCFGVLLG